MTTCSTRSSVLMQIFPLFLSFSIFIIIICNTTYKNIQYTTFFYTTRTTYSTRTTYNTVLYYVFFPFYTHRKREKNKKKKKAKKKGKKLPTTFVL